MFTGLIELLCPITAVEPLDSTQSGGGGYSITIGNATDILTDCSIGDSIAVNGTCLTVTEFTKDSFKIGVAPETLKKTNLGQLKVGGQVNCERAMKGEKRFGGHFVQGHVDTTAVLRSVVPNGNALTLTLRLSTSEGLPAPSSLSPYLIPKGYVTLDGASLTLIDVSPPEGGKIEGTAGDLRSEVGASDTASSRRETVEFSVMLIKHTQDVIGLSKKTPGELVNVELDIVGKYVYRSIQISASKSLSDPVAPASGSPSMSNEPVEVDSDGKQIQAATDGDSLVQLIRREVRRVLNETS
ncbi:unnamed protein product [Sympodiomycopsis kandeliae]